MPVKLGVCEWCLPVSGPFALVLAKKAGFEGLQLGDLGGAVAGFPMNNRHVQEGYLELSENHGIALQALHPTGLQRQGTMLQPSGTLKGDEARLSLLKSLDACTGMGIKEIMVSSFFATTIKTDEEFEIFSEHLEYICQAACDRGVTVSYESVLPTEKIWELIHRTNGRLKICYDILNPIEFRIGEPVLQVREFGAERIAHFHIKDGPADFKNCLPLGEGIGVFREILGVIREIGFDGWLMSENDYSFLAAKHGTDFIEAAAKDAFTTRLLLTRAY
jgi:sugar phosphate isomerase/epimerase